jgi:hypothetical protein
VWPLNFSDRLAAWHDLRVTAQALPLEPALELVNTWWFHTPWTAHYLHWDDQPKWPDPWQLLSDNVFCEVARGLGILYTVSMIDHPEITSAELVTTDQGYNLVQINRGIYTLNWDQDTVVNTHSATQVRRQLTQEQGKSAVQIKTTKV